MEGNREKTCCFTGHRKVPDLEGLWVRRCLRKAITDLYNKGVNTFLAGGAKGFDTMAAQETLRLRDTKLSDLRLVLVLPAQDQAKGWRPREAITYHNILSRADQVICLGYTTNKETLLLRDRYMVENSAYCLYYMPKEVRGGTLYTVNYAKQQGVEIISLTKPEGPANREGSEGAREKEESKIEEAEKE